MFLSHVANKSKHHSDINALIAKFGSSPPTINFNADYAERDYMYIRNLSRAVVTNEEIKNRPTTFMISLLTFYIGLLHVIDRLWIIVYI